MALRFTSADQLGLCSPSVRRQLERFELPAPVGDGSGEDPDQPVSPPRPKIGRPEQDAGRELVKWSDSTPIAEYVPALAAAAAAMSSAERCALFPALMAKGPPAGIPVIGHWFVHTPNGGWRGDTKEAAIFHGQGVRADWPDYTLSIAAGAFHGLALELKAEEAGGPRSGQLITLRRLELAGYRCVVAWGFDDAKRYIERYLDLAR